MEFSDQIKQLRKENHLTQEEMAQKLSVTRQAISNWENDRNLPDLEMLIMIREVFNISLDQLILAEDKMTKVENNMAKKLIKDTDENRKAKYNMVTALVGGFLMILGFVCFFIKANSVEYIDKNGILHENFYLIPAGYLFLLVGLIVIISEGIIYFRNKRR